MKPEFVTFSGIDDSVSDRDLREYLAALRDHGLLNKIEFGVLYCREKLGKDRYPYFDWIKRFGELMMENDVRTSLHLCGKSVFEDLLQDTTATNLFLDFDGYDRFQINVNARQIHFSDNQLMEMYGQLWDKGCTYILQYHEGNSTIIKKNIDNLARVDPGSLKRLQVLYDSSKGRGLETGHWPKYFEDRLHPLNDVDCLVKRGYAGGLGPDNIRSQIDKIKLARTDGSVIAPYDYWVDMETNIRTKGLFSTRFDMQKVYDVVMRTYIS